MADVKFRVVRQALRTTTGTQDFTSSGLGTPAAGIFILTKAVTDDTAAADAALSIGFATGSTDDRSIQVYSQDAAGTSNTWRDLNDNTACSVINNAGGNDVVIVVSGTTTDGYTLDVLVTDGNAYLLTAILIGGADVSNAFVGQYSPTQDVTTVGFEPDLVFSGGVGNNTTVGQVHAILHFGVAHNAGAGVVEQAGIGWWDEDNQVTTDTGLYLDSDGLAGQTFNGASNWSHQLSDFDASGFTATGAAGSDVCYFLALKFTNGPDIKVFQESGPTATGSFSTTTPGFEPDFGLIVSTDLTAVDTVGATDADGFAITAFDATSQYSTAISSDDGVATSAAKSLSYSGGIHTLEGGSATLDKATFTSFDTSGWTFNYSAAPGTARKYIGLAIGPAAGGGGGSFVPAAATMAASTGQEFETSFAKTVEIGAATNAAYSGQAFNLDLGSSFTQETATYAAYSGQDLSVSAAKAVAQDSATYPPYTGQDKTLSLATVVEQASATASTYTGQAITVIKAKTVQIAAATYAAFNRLSFVVEYANKAASAVKRAAISIRIGLGL